MTTRSILVTGDLVLDHHIYQGRRHHFCDPVEGVKSVLELGGAALVYRLLKELLGEQDAGRNLCLGTSLEPDIGAIRSEDVPEACQAYAFWRPTKKSAAGKENVWRVSEAMGFGGAGLKAGFA